MVTELSLEKVEKMRERTIIYLLLKSLKQAQEILEVFEDKEEFNRYHKTLMFEFDNTIQKAEKFINKPVT